MTGCWIAGSGVGSAVMTSMTGLSTSISASGVGAGVGVAAVSMDIGSGVGTGYSALLACVCTPMQTAVQRIAVGTSAFFIVVILLCFW